MKKKLITFLLASVLLFSFSGSVSAASVSDIKIAGKAAISIDLDTGEIIYEKNIDNKMYPASTTKLMTSLLLAESKKPDDELTYTKSAKSQPEFAWNTNLQKLTVGEKITADNIMKAMLIYSANDAAYVAADNVAGSDEAFQKEMNDEVSKLEKSHPYMKNTHFVTPNGLDTNISNHTTTAYSLSVIAREAFKKQWILNTIKLPETEIKPVNGPSVKIENRNKLILPDEKLYDKTCLGGKTGYTSKAGKCLVALFERNNRKILGIVMDSIYDSKDETVYNDMEKLINYSYSAEKSTLYEKNTTLKTVSANYKLFKFFGPAKKINIPLKVENNITYYDNEVNKTDRTIEYKVPDINVWNLKSSESVGNVIIKERDAVKSYNLYADISNGQVFKMKLPYYMLGAAVLIIIAGLIITLILKALRSRK